MGLVTYKLKAIDRDMADAWREHFHNLRDVQVSFGDILEDSADAIVSAANSFGYMDGSLDLKYSEHFGWHLERRVRAKILADHGGELPVGQALIVETGLEQVRYLICAPTMRVPMRVERTPNAYLAFRATIREIKRHNRGCQDPKEQISTVLVPALCAGEGRMPYNRCALQMRYAYDVSEAGYLLEMGGLATAVENHIDLVERDGPNPWVSERGRKHVSESTKDEKERNV